MESHAHGLVVGTLDGEILHLLGLAGAATDVEDRDRGRRGAVAWGEGVDFAAAGLQVDHAGVAVLALELHEILARLEVNLDEVVDADIGHEAGAGHHGDGGPAGGHLVLELGGCNGLSEVAEVESCGAKGSIGREHHIGAWNGRAAEEDCCPLGRGLGVLRRNLAVFDSEGGDEARQGLIGVHGVALDRGDELGGVFVEEGDADAVGRAGGRIALPEVEGAEGVELPDAVSCIEGCAGDTGVGTGVADADHAEGIGGGDGGGKLLWRCGVSGK